MRGSMLSARDRRKNCTPVPALPRQYQGTSMDGEWPLRDFIELGALPGAVPCARLHARQLMWEWGLTRLSESTELLVSKLVTNAMHACAGLRGTLATYRQHTRDRSRSFSC